MLPTQLLGLSRNMPESQGGLERKQDTAEIDEQWDWERWWKGCGVWSRWGMFRDLHFLRFPVWKACVLGLPSWRTGTWETLEEPFLHLPTHTLLSALSAVP